jgi:diamine N-acetyltransferase
MSIACGDVPHHHHPARRQNELMKVTLREISSETVVAVIKLSVAEHQMGFVATNAVSLAQALFSDEAWYRAIYDDEQLVGFVMLADESLKKQPPAEPNIGLWRLMIDQKHQRRGLGRETMRLVLEYVRSRPGIRSFYTSYVPGASGPGPFYLGLGFEPNGEIDDDEVVVVYPLHAGATSQKNLSE